ncbi:MAG: ATP-binding protein [Bdellovibrionaceae bacterium]|nr:ATP-binding protein [Pseudobdellovibrionaceae bacterium]
MTEGAESPSESGFGFDFTKSRNQMLIIQGVRLAFLIAILLITLIFQGLQPEFVNTSVLFPIYVMMTAMFVINGLYLVAFEWFLKYWVSTAFLFFLESAFITGLIFFTGINQSIFLFLYLVNIILAGFVFGRRGAFLLSLWTSICFSMLLIFGPEVKGQTLFFSIGLNNIAFIAVSFLSGILSEQLNFMGSELKARGKDLRALQSLNQLILENIGTGLVSIDQRGEILQGNRAAAEILDVPARGLVGKNVETWLQSIMERIGTLNFGAIEPRGDQRAESRPDRRGDRTSERFDWIYRNPDGDKLILEITVSPLLEEDGGLKGHVLAFQDSTKIRRLEFQMRQSEKMAAVGQLAAGIAHEIRNPLASISGSIQLLEGSFTSRQEEERRLMKIVLKEIDRLNNLITEFLEFVRPDQQTDDPVDISSLTREVLEMVKLNQNLRADVGQVVDLASARSIAGNRDKLKQAILNIVINSYQAMNDSSRPAAIEVRTFDRGPNVVLTIRDHGVGIEENRLRKIFEPFHTTKPKGTGLGLAVTHKIIESHGGKVFVESTKGVGTEFSLEFPARADSPKASDNLGLAQMVSGAEDLRVRREG